jgi:hypothetical protein
MEQDRVVERPEDLEKKKKGRFGFFNRKSSSNNSTKEKFGKMGSISKPPSTMWQPPVGRKSSESRDYDVDDGQPPRLNMPQQENVKSGESTPGVAVHAGFDFDAIKEVLEEVRNADESETSTNSHKPDTTVYDIASPSPIQRSESAPVLPTGQVSEVLEVFSEDEESAHSREPSCTGTSSFKAEHSRFSIPTMEDGDLGEITYNARPPPAPSISFALDNTSAWTARQEAPILPRTTLSGEESEEDDITASGGWKPPALASKPVLFSNPWDS